MKLTPQYAAGMIDADGSIAISRQQPKKDSIHIRYQARLTVTNNCPTITELFAEAYGGSLHFQDFAKANHFHRGVWSWIAVSRPAIAVLKLVRPYLIAKADQADLALQLQENIDKYKHTLGNGHWTSPERDKVMAFRQSLFEQCRDLKHATY